MDRISKTTLIALICIGWTICSCHSPAGETMCGHAGVHPTPVEFYSGTLKGNTITFEDFISVSTRGGFVNYTATICNPSLLDSINLNSGATATDIVFTGHYFSVEDGTGNEVVYLKLHDIVRAPKGFDD